MSDGLYIARSGDAWVIRDRGQGDKIIHRVLDVTSGGRAQARLDISDALTTVRQMRADQ